MFAGLIRLLQGTFHAITTELEKIAPSWLRAQLRRNLYKYTRNGLAQASPGSQNFEDFFCGVDGSAASLFGAGRRAPPKRPTEGLLLGRAVALGARRPSVGHVAT